MLVAIERAIRLATRRGLPADLERWRTARDAIYRRIMDRGANHVGLYAEQIGRAGQQQGNFPRR